MATFLERLQRWDAALFRAVHQGLRSRVMDIFMPRLTHLGGPTFSALLMLAIAWYSARTVYDLFLPTLVALLVTQLLVTALKNIYARMRPYDRFAFVQLLAKPLKDYSFPSGHTAAAFTIAVSLSIQLPMYTAVLLPIALIVALTRVYIGVHYPFDCAAGASIGAGSAAGIAWVL
ncbi:phosphatase PAP2 family protein [Alkalicoccus chagannorensis]|uniref:phosphatase PAP2 family protein n=1 Tax=Alkalicoccus chagannorensis TaxID=427072 RepID=UPI00040ED693|nr:phosphatase PAP2 family protein [Alkalicoccus chagannorensis]